MRLELGKSGPSGNAVTGNSEAPRAGYPSRHSDILLSKPGSSDSTEVSIHAQGPDNRSLLVQWLASPVMQVILAGALGGLLSSIYGSYLGDKTHLATLARYAGSTALGMGAAFVGVFLLANSDITSLPALRRTLAFALVCGFAWRPVYEAGTAFVRQQVQVQRIEELGKQTLAVNDRASQVPAEVANKTSELLLEVSKVDRPEVSDKASAQAERVVATLAAEAPKKPEAARALAQIAKTATETGNAVVAASAVDGIQKAAVDQPGLAPNLQPELESIARSADLKSMPTVAAKARGALIGRETLAAPEPTPAASP